MAEEHMNIHELALAPILGKFELVIIPSLIKVQVIKKKIVEQMSEPPIRVLEEAGNNSFKVIGRVGPYVVYHCDSHQFVKAHRNDFVDYVMAALVRIAPRDKRIDHNKISEEAITKFNSLPQMFEG